MRRTLLLFLIFFSTGAVADEWMPPTQHTYESADRRARLVVTPRPITSPLAYFEDKVAGREPAGAPADSKRMNAIATLQIRGAAGQWVTSWTKPLINEVSPVDVVVANGGGSVVTFDNWHSMGYGRDTIVVYDSRGSVVRALALEDVFPKWFVAAQPHSVSSIWWRGQPRISDDGAAVVIPIKLPNDESSPETEGPTFDLRIRLSDGDPVGLADPKWKAALARAAATTMQMCREERERIAAWNSPITAPTQWSEPDWYHYLDEIFSRTSPPQNEDFPTVPATTVLRPRSAHDFQASVKWLQESLTKSADLPGDDVRAIGSPDYNALTVEIERLGRSLKPNQLKGVRLIVVMDSAHAERVRSSLSRSGAELRIVNPLDKIPEQPWRMQDPNPAKIPVCQTPQDHGADPAS